MLNIAMTMTPRKSCLQRDLKIGLICLRREGSKMTLVKALLISNQTIDTRAKLTIFLLIDPSFIFNISPCALQEVGVGSAGLEERS